MKHIANIITLSRIAFAFTMVLAVPFSTLFWSCYFLAGFSDIVDGYVARKLNQQSAMGAKLDSIADLAFAVFVLIVIIRSTSVPIWLWLCGAIIVLIRAVTALVALVSAIHELAITIKSKGLDRDCKGFIE